MYLMPIPSSVAKKRIQEKFHIESNILFQPQKFEKIIMDNAFITREGDCDTIDFQGFKKIQSYLNT